MWSVPAEGKAECLRVSTAVKKPYDHSNSDKGKYLLGDSLEFQRFSPLSSWLLTIMSRSGWPLIETLPRWL